MAYQPSWVILFRNYSCRIRKVILFNPTWGDNRVHAFPAIICPKMNLIETWVRTDLLRGCSSALEGSSAKLIMLQPNIYIYIYIYIGSISSLIQISLNIINNFCQQIFLLIRSIKAIRQYERISKKICRQKMSIMFNEICINIHIYIYIYIYGSKW